MKIEKSPEIHLKQSYKNFADRIYDKRFRSKFRQRRYVHRQIYMSFLNYAKPNLLVADIGAGEGVLSFLMAKKGARVIAVEISSANIARAVKLSRQQNLKNISFVMADAENPPFKKSSFDLVVSSHVLEHLPDFDKGLQALKYIAKKRIVFAVPTCLNWCAIPLLGGGNYWSLEFTTPFHLIIGIARIIKNFFSEGVNENYAGKKLPHIWRYPWALIRRIKKAGLQIVDLRASTLVPPYLLTYFPSLYKSYRTLDTLCHFPLLKYLGYGTQVEAIKS